MLTTENYNNNSNMSGIYKITCLINNKIYIGRATRFSSRKHTHCQTLRKNRHCNCYLQSDFNNFNEDDFIFDIISIENEDNVIKAEEYWIKFYNATDINFGYNICIKSGLHPHKEYRKILSDRAIKKRGSNFELLSPSGELINGRGVKRFCEENGLDRWGILCVLKGRHKQYKGWRLPTTDFDLDFFDNYKFISPDGKLLEVSKGELKSFCLKNGFHSRDYVGLLEVWGKKTKYNKGWTRFDLPSHYIFYNPNNQIVYIGRGFISEFCRKNNILRGNLVNVIKGLSKNYNGWRFVGELRIDDVDKLAKY